ncbi:type II toxin-antitoxin system VapC family toxin [Nitratifractor sp.]
MKVLLDTNIILDFLLEREPFASDARQIVAAIERGEIEEGYLCPTSVTTLHYLIAKAASVKTADEMIAKLLRLFRISQMDKTILLEAAERNGSDYEDSVIYTSALHTAVDAIVTRDAKGFKRSKVSTFTPSEFLVKLKR